MAEDINNPATLPMADRGAALNRILGVQTRPDGTEGYSLFPLEALSDQGAAIAWIAYHPEGDIVPGQVERGTLSIGTGDGNSYSTPLDLPPGAPGTPGAPGKDGTSGKDGTPGVGFSDVTVTINGGS
ncbi:hypothetical protein E3E12_08140 [Formicincola oecophyllae]|uniref:Uncharacterized protein n=1 Tax=Formicincola oecophyllae TaxID=2558361 RepID=A0A4Y6UDR4_9PROT|nr:hypothetical protein [Formicincola oecophyllae]QDH14165.1 hypothetical protein E3E12_08140 [Formicincola oecophyllae]